MNIRLSEFLTPGDDKGARLAKQCGVDDVVTIMTGAEQQQRMFAHIGHGRRASAGRGREVPWSLDALTRVKAGYAEYNLTVRVVEDTPPLDLARTGAVGRDEQIDHVLQQIESMRQLEIPVLCYNWSAVSGWARTEPAGPGRGGALVTSFNLARANELPPLTDETITHEQVWDALTYFLDAVIPAAEAAGVRLALHPDDPPLPTLRGVPRVMWSVDSYRKLLQVNPSPANAITFCQGNFALMTDDLPGTIREFGTAGRIAFVHFRDVRGTAENFTETFHDDGDTDMAECLRAYAAVGYDGPLRADHVPSMDGEPNDRPGYGSLGRLFALGYIRGLLHGVVGR